MNPLKCCLKLFLLWAVLIFTGCASKPLPNSIHPRTIYPQASYAFFAQAEGFKVAAVPFSPGRDIYADPALPVDEEDGLPLNVLDAGVFPVRLILWNETGDEILLDPMQITALGESASFRLYTPEEAVAVVIGSEIFAEAIKGSQVMPVVKSFLGGEILLEAAKSGVGGAASGGIAGGATGMARGAAGVGMGRAKSYEKGLVSLISREYADQAIQRQVLYPGFFADGLIFLPNQQIIHSIEIRAYAQDSKKAILIHLPLSRLD